MAEKVTYRSVLLTVSGDGLDDDKLNEVMADEEGWGVEHVLPVLNGDQVLFILSSPPPARRARLIA